jgi:DNA-binding Lrp family transcriptional regulator
MDDIDYRLVLELQNDPRKQNTELAQLLGVSEATVRRHIKDLVESGTITLTALPNLTKVGYKTRAFIGLQVEVSKVEGVAERLARYPEVHYLGFCAGAIDIFIWGLFSSTEHLSRFITTELGQIPGIMRMETMVQLRAVKATLGRLHPDAVPTRSRNR